MKILHINSYYSTTPLYTQMYERQREKGYTLDVYVPVAHQITTEKLPTMVKEAQVVPVFNQWERYIFWLKHHKILKDLNARYEANNYDLIHAHSLFSNGWLAYKLHQEYQIPYIVAVRNTDLYTFFNKQPWMRSLGRKILAQAAKIIYISKNTYRSVMQQYIPEKERPSLEAKSVVIPNGIDAFWFDHAQCRTKTPTHTPIQIVSIGKLQSLKHFVELAELVESYHSRFRPTHLHIIGPEMEESVKEKLLNLPHVTYHGSMDKQAIQSFLKNMDIFALLSYPETFGLVYVEAMSQGLPVIYTRGQGFDGYFPNHEVGVSVTPFNQAEFDDAMNYILHQYPKLSKNAHTRSFEFNWDDIMEEYDLIYRKILNGE